ncbi:dethiobiotin synthase [Craterilacuibacter sp.]|uniref:dethiobiotin synthase n=1 Tax=Craterilacuibacter sp. TaxID=2870909 RepID=UPI003F4060A2
MTQGYFITGTDTDCGKTHSTVKLIRTLQAEGKRVLAMKPVASGCIRANDGTLINDDVERLIAATAQQDRALMSPYRFEPAISPHIAAREAGIEVLLTTICQHYRQLAADADVVLVEGAGGWFAPLSDRITIQDLAQALQLPVILVVGMKLGCINHARLSAQAIATAGCTLAGWIANRIEPEQARYSDNLATLKQQLPAPLLLELPWEG